MGRERTRRGRPSASLKKECWADEMVLDNEASINDDVYDPSEAIDNFCLHTGARIIVLESRVTTAYDTAASQAASQLYDGTLERGDDGTWMLLDSETGTMPEDGDGAMDRRLPHPSFRLAYFITEEHKRPTILFFSATSGYTDGIWWSRVIGQNNPNDRSTRDLLLDTFSHHLEGLPSITGLLPIGKEGELIPVSVQKVGEMGVVIVHDIIPPVSEICRIPRIPMPDVHVLFEPVAYLGPNGEPLRKCYLTHTLYNYNPRRNDAGRYTGNARSLTSLNDFADAMTPIEKVVWLQQQHVLHPRSFKVHIDEYLPKMPSVITLSPDGDLQYGALMDERVIRE